MKLLYKFIFYWIISNSFCLISQTNMVYIKGGNYIPLYGRDSLNVSINDFLMDIQPVTNSDFLIFLENNPKWRRSKAIKIFVDGNYLREWATDITLALHQNIKAPITNISWFVAKAYCQSKGKRLPTVDEWEYVAMANDKLADARILSTYNKYILSWYEKPNTYNNSIGLTFKNYWGVYDLHGLVWEWALDFNSVLISGESRKDVDKDNNLFCGSAALGATDLMNYAAFMRYAIRGSLKARYTMKNLGFRCVKDINTSLK